MRSEETLDEERELDPQIVAGAFARGLRSGLTYLKKLEEKMLTDIKLCFQSLAKFVDASGTEGLVVENLKDFGLPNSCLHRVKELVVQLDNASPVNSAKMEATAITVNIQYSNTGKEFTLTLNADSTIADLKAAISVSQDVPKGHDLVVRFGELTAENNDKLNDVVKGGYALLNSFEPFPVKCLSCNQFFSISTRKPVVLQCGHSICIKCFDNGEQLTKEFEQAESNLTQDSFIRIRCASCNSLSRFDNSNRSPTNESLSELADWHKAQLDRLQDSKVASEVMCSCGEYAAVVYCENCEKDYCEACDTDIHSIPRFKSHKRISRLEKVVEILPLCDQHREESKFYCQTHDVLVCPLCVINDGSHCAGSGHEVKPIEEAAKIIRNGLHLDKLEMKQMEEKAQSESSALREGLDQMDAQFAAIVNQMKAHFDIFRRLLAEREESLTNALRAEKLSKEVRIIGFLNKVASFVAGIYAIEEGFELFTNCTDVALLQGRERFSLTLDYNQLASLLSERPNVCTSSLLFFENEKLLADAISEFGSRASEPTPPSNIVCSFSEDGNVVTLTWDADDNGSKIEYLWRLDQLVTPLEVEKAASNACQEQQDSESKEKGKIDCNPEDSFEDDAHFTATTENRAIFDSLGSQSNYQFVLYSRCRVTCAKSERRIATFQTPPSCNAFYNVNWDSSRISPTLYVESRLLRSRAEGTSYNVALGNRSICLNPCSGQLGCFEVCFREVQHNDNQVGLASYDVCLTSHLGGAQDKPAIAMWSSSGKTHCTLPNVPAQTEKRNVCFGASPNDRVTVLVDCRGDVPLISWFVNDALKYEVSIPSECFGLELFPAVNLRNSTGNAVEFIRCNSSLFRNASRSHNPASAKTVTVEPSQTSSIPSSIAPMVLNSEPSPSSPKPPFSPGGVIPEVSAATLNSEPSQTSSRPPLSPGSVIPPTPPTNSLENKEK